MIYPTEFILIFNHRSSILFFGCFEWRARRSHLAKEYLPDFYSRDFVELFILQVLWPWRCCDGTILRIPPTYPTCFWPGLPGHSASCKISPTGVGLTQKIWCWSECELTLTWWNKALIRVWPAHQPAQFFIIDSWFNNIYIRIRRKFWIWFKKNYYFVYPGCSYNRDPRLG